MKTSQASTKFLIVFGVLAVLMLFTTMFVAWKMSNIDREIKGLSSGPTRAALEVNRAGRVLVKAQASIADVLLARNASERGTSLQELAQARATYTQQLDKASSDDPTNASAYEALKADGLAAIDSACGPTLQAAHGAPNATATTDSAALYQQQCAPPFNKVIEGITAKSLAATAADDAQ
jgi:hypothetical protein